VYRNTKQILTYIKSLGYDIEIPNNIKNGSEVKTKTVDKFIDIIDFIRENTNRDQNQTIGVLCDTEEMKKALKIDLGNLYDKIIVLTKKESQGTEFNDVFVINEFFNISDKDTQNIDYNLQIRRNMNYIGYTRAVENLYVLDFSNQEFL
jgi:superfamily I DNA/RNA helicase